MAVGTGTRERRSIRQYMRPKAAAMLALGFSAGLPFMLTGNTLGYWLRDEGTTLTAIGFLSWVGLAYSFKFLWAPFIDRAKAPLFGRLGSRRGWMLLAQIIVAIGLAGMAFVGTGNGLITLGVFALVVAFASATQDIVVDAWRIESADNGDELGLLSSAYQLGYRAALLVTESLILISAQHLGWMPSYWVMAALMAVGITATLVVAESAKDRARDADTAAGSGDIPVPHWRTWTASVFLAAAAVASLAVTWDAGGPSTMGIAIAIFLALLAIISASHLARSGFVVSGIAFLAIVARVFWASVFGDPVIGGTLLLIPAALTGIGAALLSPPLIFNAVIGPLIAFIKHYGWLALVMLTMIALYRLPDFMMGPMANPFYHDIGLSKDMVGAVRGSIGWPASLVGIAVGGFIALRFGYMQSLILGGIMQALAIAAFAILAYSGGDLTTFSVIMALDSFATSFAGVALVTYMSSLTSVGYTATQYALLSSVYAYPGKILKGTSGAIVEGLAQQSTLMDAYAMFFIGAGAVGIPAIALCIFLMRAQHRLTPDGAAQAKA